MVQHELKQKNFVLSRTGTEHPNFRFVLNFKGSIEPFYLMG